MVGSRDDGTASDVALAPYLSELRAALHSNDRQPAREPYRIAVPVAFPEDCDVMVLWGLPVERIPGVERPQVNFRRRPTEQQMTPTPVPKKQSAAGEVVQGRYGSMRSITVYATLKGPRYHVRKDCSGLAVELRTTDPRLCHVTSNLVHRSRLEPCDQCSADGIAKALNAAFGYVDPKLRPRLGIPPEMMQLPPAEYPPSPETMAFPAVEDDAANDWLGNWPPYGEPQKVGDPRFQTRASTEWGTASFAADPDEFLGEPTEDDHDWRSASDGYLD